MKSRAGDCSAFETREIDTMRACLTTSCARAVAFALLVAMALACASIAKAGPASQPASAPSAEIAKLIGQLADQKWTVREAADKKLRQSRDPAVVPALRKAAESTDLEIQFRAKLILASLLKFTHVVVDAQGAPIADATITITYANNSRLRDVLKTNVFGGVTLPDDAMRQGTFMHFSHDDYGQAQGRPTHRPSPSADEPPVAAEFRVSLVRKDSPAFARALKGTVLDPDGKPVQGAQVTCNIARTPGEGLIQYPNVLPAVLTDAKGHFSLYLPDFDPRHERGSLIPPNSRFRIAIAAKDDLFPYQGEHDNTKEATIRLQRAELFHRFEFETADGGRVTDNTLAYIRIAYQPTDGGPGVVLGQEYVRDGGKLVPGRYVAYKLNEKYVPLEVTKNSPETLLFRLPPPVTFRGRVADGVADKPLAGAFVLGINGTGSKSLAMLTERDWKDLESLPARPASNATELKCLNDKYEVIAITRTDAKGQYQLTQPGDRKFYSVLAFARGQLPYNYRVVDLKPDAKNVVPLPELPLFPAATIIVKPVATGLLHVSPQWSVAQADQPEWFGRLMADIHPGNSRPGCVDWLELNKSQPIYVPANVKLQLSFDVPYNNEVCAARYDKPVKLAPGKSLDIGEVTFAPALKVQVRVIDKAGQSVEGVPVRYMRKDDNSWNVAHNTDEQGLAQFYAEPGTSGQYAIWDLYRGGTPKPNEIPQVKADIGTKAPEKPFVITVTDAQIKALIGTGTPVKTRGAAPK